MDNWSTEYKAQLTTELNELREQLAEYQRIPNMVNRMAYVINDMAIAAELLKDNNNVVFGQRIDGWITDINDILAPYLEPRITRQAPEEEDD